MTEKTKYVLCFQNGKWLSCGFEHWNYKKHVAWGYTDFLLVEEFSKEITQKGTTEYWEKRALGRYNPKTQQFDSIISPHKSAEAWCSLLKVPFQ